MKHRADWYQDLVIYQIYPRSFCDSDGDGVGDLRGILEKLDYLEELGVSAIWLSPIYASPNVDNGYDVSDYHAILPEFGTMEDWRALRDGAHSRHIAVIMDLVLNHTSDQHRWFQASRSSRDNPYSDYYVWRDPSPEGPPNRWRAVFGGSAWEYAPERGQYYLHLFSKEQPDLNWDNPQVREEICRSVEWWAGEGVDGFRVDAISYLDKGLGPVPELGEAVMGTAACSNLPNTHRYLQELSRRAFQPGNLMSVGEVTCTGPDCAWDFTARERGEFNMIIPFVSPPDEISSWSPAAMKAELARMYQRLKKDGWWARFFSNHDKPRQVSLYGDDGAYRVPSAKMLAALLHTLPGTPFIYQGEEIGMTNISYSTIEEYDDIDTRGYYRRLLDQGTPPEIAFKLARNASRDNARTPMQWDGSPNAGFSTGTPWLKVNPNYRDINVAEQRGREDSIYAWYRALIRLRRDHPILVHGDFTPVLEENDTVIAYTRALEGERWLAIHAFSGAKQEITLPEGGEILLSNYGRTGRLSGTVTLAPYECLLLQIT